MHTHTQSKSHIAVILFVAVIRFASSSSIFLLHDEAIADNIDLHVLIPNHSTFLMMPMSMKLVDANRYSTTITYPIAKSARSHQQFTVLLMATCYVPDSRKSFQLT